MGWPHSVADFCDFVGTGGSADHQSKPHNAGEVNSLIVDRDATVKVFVVGPNDRLCINMRDATPRYQGTGSLLRTDNNLTESGTEGGSRQLVWLDRACHSHGSAHRIPGQVPREGPVRPEPSNRGARYKGAHGPDHSVTPRWPKEPGGSASLGLTPAPNPLFSSGLAPFGQGTSDYVASALPRLPPDLLLTTRGTLLGSSFRA